MQRGQWRETQGLGVEYGELRGSKDLGEVSVVVTKMGSNDHRRVENKVTEVPHMRQLHRRTPGEGACASRRAPCEDARAGAAANYGTQGQSDAS